VTKADTERARLQAEELLLLVPQLAIGFKSLMSDAPAKASPVGRPSPRHMAILISLSAKGPASVTDIATRMNLTLTHASQIVGDLATSGLVERREDAHDRRRTIVSVSPSSHTLIESVTNGAARPLTAFCASLPAPEAQQFIAHLTLLASSLAPVVGRVTRAKENAEAAPRATGKAG
jgi:DNA-binding MarR family transcriptional regulator